MGSVDNVDHKMFIPIKLDTQPQNTAVETGTNLIGTSSGLNFQRLLQSATTGGNLETTPYGSVNNEDSLLSLLMQCNNLTNPLKTTESLQSGLIAQYLGQINPFSKTQLVKKYKTMASNFPFVSPDMGITQNSGAGTIQNITDATIPGVNPTKPQIVDYITEQCELLGIPKQLGLATAATESGMTQFTKDGIPVHSGNADSGDWGIMQINDKAWGKTFDLNRIKSDWQYNVRSGLRILKDSYQAAFEHNEGIKGENGIAQNLARAAYSGYNAGTSTVWRYRTPVNAAPKTEPYGALNQEGYDLRDQRFWRYYQLFS